MSDQDEHRSLPIGEVKQEEGARDLATSAAMQPYLRLAEAVITGKDESEAIAEIAALPLEDRYVWRIASALKWGFADFDDLSVVADRDTLSEHDTQRLFDLLRLRPIQFCMFLAALYGSEAMETIMQQAVKTAKQQS